MPPRVAILAPPESRADSETLNVRAALTPGIGGIGRIEWRVNGIVRVARAPASSSPPSGTAIEIEDPLLLEAGENIVELTVYNATNRIASSPVRVKVNWDAPPQAVAPRMFVLSIGVDDYWDSRLRRNGPVRSRLLKRRWSGPGGLSGARRLRLHHPRSAQHL